jgi:hypothetical protein
VPAADLFVSSIFLVSYKRKTIQTQNCADPEGQNVNIAETSTHVTGTNSKATRVFIMAQAPAQASPLDEQPDIPKLQRNIAEISVEVGRFSNIPAIAGADRILEAIECMKTDLTAAMTAQKTDLTAAMTAQKTDLTAAMDSMKTELINQITISLRALDANTTARFVNNQNVRTLDSPVEKLVNVTNGADIPDFPSTFRQIMNLQSRFRLFPPFLLSQHQG